MPYSFDEALLLLQTTDLTPQALTNLAKQVSIEVQGAVTVLYGGKLPDGSSASNAVTAMVTNGEDIRVIDKSAAGRFLSSIDFRAAAAKASGLIGADFDDFLQGTYTGTATNWLYSTDINTSPWADASKRFAEATTGEVRLLASGADATRIFNQVELPTLLQKADITKIEGYTLDALKAMYPEAGGIPPNTSKIFEGLKLASEQNIVFSGLTVSSKGTIAGKRDFIDMASATPLQLAIDGAGISLYDHQVVFGSKSAISFIAACVNETGGNGRLGCKLHRKRPSRTRRLSAVAPSGYPNPSLPSQCPSLHRKCGLNA